MRCSEKLGRQERVTFVLHASKTESQRWTQGKATAETNKIADSH